MTITRLCLIRHGETDWNAIGRFQGSIDIPLNAKGITQAQAAGEALKQCKFDALYSSDLQRARMTADVVAETLQRPIIPEPRLRERHLGLLEGLMPAEAEAKYPDAYLPLKARRLDYAPPQGEEVAAFQQRVSAVLQHILHTHPGQQILAVAHGGVLDMFYRLVTGTGFNVERSWRLRNGALNWLEHDGKTWRVEAWDEIAHLSATRDEKAA